MDELNIRIDCAAIIPEYNMLLNKDTPLQDSKLNLQFNSPK